MNNSCRRNQRCRTLGRADERSGALLEWAYRSHREGRQAEWLLSPFEAQKPSDRNRPKPSRSDNSGLSLYWFLHRVDAADRPACDLLVDWRFTAGDAERASAAASGHNGMTAPAWRFDIAKLTGANCLLDQMSRMEKLQVRKLAMDFTVARSVIADGETAWTKRRSNWFGDFSPRPA